jgi:hypothetical protein
VTSRRGLRAPSAHPVNCGNLVTDRLARRCWPVRSPPRCCLAEAHRPAPPHADRGGDHRLTGGSLPVGPAESSRSSTRRVGTDLPGRPGPRCRSVTSSACLSAWPRIHRQGGCPPGRPTPALVTADIQPADELSGLRKLTAEPCGRVTQGHRASGSGTRDASRNRPPHRPR